MARYHGAVAAAASLSGRRFGALVASSVLATSIIVAAGLTATGNGPLAALLGRSLAAGSPPAQQSGGAPAGPGGTASASPSGSAPPGASVVPTVAPAPPPAPVPVPSPAPAPAPA